MGEAGRPDGQSRSDMTAAAVGVGGLALWRGHARRCRPSSIVRASGRRRSILRVHLSSPLRQSVRAYSERDTGWWGGGGAEPTLSRLVNDAHPWKLYTHRLCGDVMYVCHSIRPTDRDNAIRPLTLKPTLHFCDLLWTCWCAVFDLVFLYKMASADDW